MTKLRVLDLFSGIGGFSLGLEAAGMTTVAFCEISPACRHLLAHHWPKVPQYDDVCTLTAERLAADGIAVDVVCGGFPCQDLSYAGAGAGLAGARSGLFWEIIRLVRELIGAGRRPQYLVLENVAALLGRGLGEVLGALASLGYDLWWDCIPAFAVGAPHRRDRVWIVAYPRGEQHQGFCDALRWAIASELSRAIALGTLERSAAEQSLPARDGAEADALDPDADSVGPYRAEVHLIGDAELRDEQERLAGSVGENVAETDSGGRSEGQSAAQTLGCGGLSSAGCGDVADTTRKLRNGSRSRAKQVGRSEFTDGGSAMGDANGAGLSLAGNSSGTCSPSGCVEAWRAADRTGWWATEPDVGRVAHGVPARVDRLHGLGNAVVPQIPEVLGRAILTAIEAERRAA